MLTMHADGHRRYSSTRELLVPCHHIKLWPSTHNRNSIFVVPCYTARRQDTPGPSCLIKSPPPPGHSRCSSTPQDQHPPAVNTLLRRAKSISNQHHHNTISAITRSRYMPRHDHQHNLAHVHDIQKTTSLAVSPSPHSFPRYTLR